MCLFASNTSHKPGDHMYKMLYTMLYQIAAAARDWVDQKLGYLKGPGKVGLVKLDLCNALRVIY